MDLDIMGRNLIKKMNINDLVITSGRAGASILSNKKKDSIKVASYAKEIVDKIGAGDCLFALISLFLSSSFDKKLSLFLASLAAGMNVEKMGNSSYIDKIKFLKTINYILK